MTLPPVTEYRSGMVRWSHRVSLGVRTQADPRPIRNGLPTQRQLGVISIWWTHDAAFHRPDIRGVNLVEGEEKRTRHRPEVSRHCGVSGTTQSPAARNRHRITTGLCMNRDVHYHRREYPDSELEGAVRIALLQLPELAWSHEREAFFLWQPTSLKFSVRLCVDNPYEDLSFVPPNKNVLWYEHLILLDGPYTFGFPRSLDSESQQFEQ
ncbi:hypothetical protein FB45DRAFT_876689 [Roridomyces roridus]|uniref:Uncharacterized protein n=1 Tax=Roridomyces roridus TaxID=1738132 RepID=A0AAD7B324_9AGAR|nr:hypothetical protein FB45DRAFT_876689 [Roridomyces roridus]